MAKETNIAELQRRLKTAEREVGKVHGELAAALKYEAAGETGSADSTTYDPTAPCRLLDLPIELRDAIYELCVVVDKVYFTPTNTVTTWTRPPWKIFVATNLKLASSAV